MYNSQSNNLAEIVYVSLGLGAVVAWCLYTIFTSESFKKIKLLLYLLLLALFHYNEFISTAKYNGNKVTSRLFLVYGQGGSKEYWAIQSMNMIEFYLKLNVESNWFILGVMLAVLGILLRHLSIKTCGASFNHYIETEKQNKLVTHGVYGLSRHPSYLGFWIFVNGIQILLGNMLSMIICLIVMNFFFKKRIRFEEWFLVKFHGDAYLKYKQRVRVLIPLI